MLLNILKCDGCNVELPYSNVETDCVSRIMCKRDLETECVGKVFKFLTNEERPSFETDQCLTYHLCNKCFEQLKEKLDNVIAEFKGDSGKEDSICLTKEAQDLVAAQARLWKRSE